MNSISIEIPTEVIEQIARQVCQEMMPAPAAGEAESTCAKVAQLMAKPYWSIRESAFVFGCSENHVRNLIQRAVDRSTQFPIPFCSLDGLIVFEREALLAWVKEAKPLGQRKSGGKKKQFPRAVNS